MDSLDDEGTLCPVCNDPITDLHHNSTVNHRFQFAKWQYNQYRKPLLNDRHGITINIEVELNNNFHCKFHYYKGKYTTRVTPEQLELHNSSIAYKCTLKNTSKKPIYITHIDLLHPSDYFSIKHSNNFANNDLVYLQLNPDAEYIFKIFFQTDIPTCASYKIPLSCDFQTVDQKSNNFTILRALLNIIDEQTEEEKKKTKSPFTSQPWKDVTKTIPTTKELFYQDQYPIPGKYMKILKYGLTEYNDMTSTEEYLLRDLRQLLQRLTRENYNRYWHIVLWLEERAQSLMLMKYNMQEVTMELKDEEILVLTVPGLAEKRPSVIVGDFIRIRLTGDHVAYKGFVGRVNELTVEILHVDDELLDYIRDNPTAAMDVAFMLSRLSFERMHQAVDQIVASGMVAKLFPEPRILTNTRTILQLDNSQLFNQSIANNSEQKNAVYKIINNVHDLPYIVFGPPGTGKTITIVEAILQIKKRTKKRILVCAPANSACDMIATKLMPHCSKEELIRIHSSTRERTTITEELMEYSNMEDDEFTRVTISKLLSYRIVVTTLTLIGRYARDYHPDCVFVDEAAQASEPETDIAIALVHVGKLVVLAGDPKQLGPMAQDSAVKYGLGVSLLERLMDFSVYKLDSRTRRYNTDFITMLKQNFRSHKDILSISNELFYDNLLVARSLDAERDPIVSIAIFPTTKKKGASNNRGKAIEFYSLSAKEQKEGSSPSYFNFFEAEMVVKYVQAIIKLPLALAYKVRQDQIGVVTPYKRQVHKIKEGLRFKGLEGVEVGTTESFQGREKRVIIISTVRAQHSLLLYDRKYNLGFIKHDKRFNVAVTRAISKLIVVGSPLVLKNDRKWKMYMDLCQRYGTYFGNNLDNSSESFKKEVIDKMRNFKSKDDQYHN